MRIYQAELSITDSYVRYQQLEVDRERFLAIFNDKTRPQFANSGVIQGVEEDGRLDHSLMPIGAIASIEIYSLMQKPASDGRFYAIVWIYCSMDREPYSQNTINFLNEEHKALVLKNVQLFLKSFRKAFAGFRVRIQRNDNTFTINVYAN